MKKIYIFRHGQTHHNKEGRFTGLNDDVLTDLGHLQAQKVAEYLQNHKLDRIYTSALQRTRQTADPYLVISGMDHIPLHYFNERDLGPFNGSKVSQVLEEHPDFYDKAFSGLTNDLGVENYNDFRRRIFKGLEILLSHVDEELALFTHGGTIRHIVPLLTDQEIDHAVHIDNASVTILIDTGASYKIEVLADATHLD